MAGLLEQCDGFEWDSGSAGKNWLRHNISDAECEQVFFNKPLIMSDDTKHSQSEKRWYVLGKTDSNRLLFVVFTIRSQLIRVISARNMNKKERGIYYEQEEKSS